MKILALFVCLLVITLAFFSLPEPQSGASANLIDLSGEGTYEVFPGKTWQFFGPVRSLSIGDGQRLLGSAAAVLGTNQGSTRAAIAICFQRAASDPIVPLVGDNHLNVTIDPFQRSHSVHAAVSLPRGTYNVGFCVVNLGKEIIGNNNYVNGWVLISD